MWTPFYGLVQAREQIHSPAQLLRIAPILPVQETWPHMPRSMENNLQPTWAENQASYRAQLQNIAFVPT